YDLIIVNILANVINKIRFDLRELIDKNGTLILSGITYSQKNSILMHFLSIGFVKIKEYQYEEWVTLTLVYCKSNHHRK
ncbi:MAG: 50S ribosomal protein L11 methyltransferase, partial [Hyphomicrobiales bacterium]